ncbi:S-layer homology domain-containing protein [Paenibacillus sp. 2TAB19]
MNKLRKRMAMLLLGSMTLGLIPAPAGAVPVPYDSIPKLLITEVVPDSENISPTIATDAYEFIEVYNNTDENIDFDGNYSIVYRNGGTDTPWNATDADGDIVIPAHQSVAFWIMNASNTAFTEADFNTNYGTSLVEGVSLFRLNGGGGLHNSSPRDILIKDAGGAIIAMASYENDAQTVKNKGILYKYPIDGSVQMRMMTNPGSKAATPGLAEAGQVPDESSGSGASYESSLAIVHAPAAETGLADYTITAELTDYIGTVTSSVYYKTDEQSEYTQLGGETIVRASGTDYSLTAMIPHEAFADNSVLSYYIEAQDESGDPSVVSETYDVNVTPEGEEPANEPEELSLLITELVPDSTNVGASDGYEFIELYNPSSEAVSLNDYELYYRNGGTDTRWPLQTADEVTIPARDAIVLWVINADNGAATADMFNANYGGAALAEGVDLFRLAQTGGMANGGPRTLVVKSKSGKEIVSAAYENDAQTVPDKGIFYSVPISGTSMLMMAGAGTAAATPGRVAAEQLVPPGGNMPPVITHTPSAGVQLGSDAAITVAIANAESDQGKTDDPVSAALYYKSESQQYYTAAAMTTTGGGVYKASIPRAAQVESKLEYYVQAKDSVHTVESEHYELPVTGFPVFNANKVPPLLITELLPNSVNVGSADGYEFIEIYNNTTEDINFQDYKLYYRYTDSGPSADVIWPTDREDITIPAESSVVFWVINSANTAKTAADFNAQFGVDLVEGESLFKVYSDGMANGSRRGVVIGTNTHKEVSAVYYDGALPGETSDSKGIYYAYPRNGSVESFKYSVGTKAATPGSLEVIQKPADPIRLTADTNAPVIDDVTALTEVAESETLKLVADVRDDREVRTVTVYVKTNADAGYTKHYLYEDYDDKMFHFTVASPEMVGKAYVEYYFEASDGTHKEQSAPVRVNITGGSDRSELRLNAKDGKLVSGIFELKATSESEDADALTLTVDEAVQSDTYRALEHDAYFAFEAAEVNYYFKNAVTMGEEILYTFMDPINTYTTLNYLIASDRLKLGDNKIAIRAGTKTGPFDNRPEENKDDFKVRNVRLVLSDGTVIYDSLYADKSKDIKMGDSAGKFPAIEFNLTLEEDMLRSKALAWDTTKLTDGKHTVTVSAGGASSVSAEVTVDNTAPTITPSLQDGETYRGQLTIDAVVSDALAGVKSVTAALDGEAIELPYATSSGKLTSGEHTLTVKATDQAGNASERTITFNVPNENPDKPELIAPLNGSSLTANRVNLTVKATDPMGDMLKLTFYKGFNFDALSKQGFTAYSGASDTEPPKQLQPGGEQLFTKEDYAKIAKADGEYLVNNSVNQFPYHRFDMKLDSSVKASDLVDIEWSGKSLEGRKVSLYAWDQKAGKWALLDYKIAGEEDFTLSAQVKAGDYNAGGVIHAMVQDELPVTQDEYDFSFVWMSDTQYYSESYPEIYEGNVNWIVDSQDEMNIKYVIHTGDIVDDADQAYQWTEANKSMKVLEDANMPYGVLAGNHDVSHQTGDYSYYWKHYGEDRFKDEPHYGGSYQNNRGHYDLISAGGVDFIIVYMGWNIGDDEIQWVNDAVAAYPDRKAILAFHEYMLVSNNRAPIADKIYERVVVPNPNVIATLSGHYHDAETLVDEIDDNGDGTPDRKVYQMLADYQGAEMGGLGYIRLMQFDLKNNQIHMKTYSPYLDDYNYYDPTEYPGKDEFDMDVDLREMNKRVATDYFGVKVYTDQKIGTVQNAASGSEATVTWSGLKENRYYEWYVAAEDANSGYTLSDIWGFAVGDLPNSGNGNGNGETEIPTEPEEPTEPEIPVDPTDPTEPSQPQSPFTDTKNHWASEAIDKLSGKKILSGYPDGSFKPDARMTRAEYAAVMFRLLGLAAPTSPSLSFTDTVANAWYGSYVQALTEAGIVKGFEDGSFRPRQQMTREEAFVILYRAVKDRLPAPSTGGTKIADLEGVSPWAREALTALVEAGIIKGYEDGTLRPKKTITRAEIATIIAYFAK